MIVYPFVHIFAIISLFAAELIEPKIGISGKGLISLSFLCPEIWADKKETQFQQLKENFDKLVKKLVVGGEVHLTRNVKSARLTQVLADLRELEKDKKLTVSGEVAQCSTYFHLLNE